MINCRYGGSKAMSAFTDEDSYEYDEESGGWTTSQTTSYSSSSNSNESEVSTITPSNMHIDPTFRQPNLTEEFNGHGGPTYYYEDDGNLTIDFHGQSPTRCPPRTNFEYQQQQPRQHDVPMRPDPNGKSPSSSLESQDVYQILKQQGTKSRRSKSIPRSHPISKSKPTPPSSQSSSSQTSASSSSKSSTHGSIDANFVQSIRSASWRRAESLQFEENELYQPVKDSNNNGLVLGRRESLVSDPELNLLIKTLKSERGVLEESDKAVDRSDKDDGSSSNVSYLPHNNEDTDSIEDTPNTQTVTPKLISTFSKEESKDTELTAASTVCSTTMCSTSGLDTSASTRDTGISAGPLTVASSCSPITEDGSIEMFFKEREKQRKSIKKQKKKVQQPVDEDDMSDISDESNGQKLVDQLLAQAQQKRRKPKSKRGEKRVNEVLKQAEIRAHRKQ